MYRHKIERCFLPENIAADDRNTTKDDEKLIAGITISNFPIGLFRRMIWTWTEGRRAMALCPRSGDGAVDRCTASGQAVLEVFDIMTSWIENVQYCQVCMDGAAVMEKAGLPGA